MRQLTEYPPPAGDAVGLYRNNIDNFCLVIEEAYILGSWQSPGQKYVRRLPPRRRSWPDCLLLLFRPNMATVIVHHLLLARPLQRQTSVRQAGFAPIGADSDCSCASDDGRKRSSNVVTRLGAEPHESTIHSSSVWEVAVRRR